MVVGCLTWVQLDEIEDTDEHQQPDEHERKRRDGRYPDRGPTRRAVAAQRRPEADPGEDQHIELRTQRTLQAARSAPRALLRRDCPGDHAYGGAATMFQAMAAIVTSIRPRPTDVGGLNRAYALPHRAPHDVAADSGGQRTRLQHGGQFGPVLVPPGFRIQTHQRRDELRLHASLSLLRPIDAMRRMFCSCSSSAAVPRAVNLYGR